MSKYSEMWDQIVAPAAKEVIEKATVDQEAIKFYVSGMIWAVEHDLADGREVGLGALNALLQVKGVFSSESYFSGVHPTTPDAEISRMRNLSCLIGDMMAKAV